MSPFIFLQPKQNRSDIDIGKKIKEKWRGKENRG
jgi:hypothetical protein